MKATLESVAAEDIAQFLAERNSKVYLLPEVHALTHFALSDLEKGCKDGTIKHTRRGRTIGLTLRQIDLLVASNETGETIPWSPDHTSLSDMDEVRIASRRGSRSARRRDAA